ncbi:hypothetical protein HD806DRAFT_259879 [Xylariaceae sp. AK1471]|nr:hypothetical protein HD806DRAFT_259879 [Xylariaceae sp. AK1471]
MVTFNTSPSPGPFSNGGWRHHEQSGYGYSPGRSGGHGNGFGRQTSQSYSPGSIFSSPKLSREPSRAVTPSRPPLNSPRADGGHGFDLSNTSFSANIRLSGSNQTITRSFHVHRDTKEPRQDERADNEQQQHDDHYGNLREASQLAPSNLPPDGQDHVVHKLEREDEHLEQDRPSTALDEPVISLSPDCDDITQSLADEDPTKSLLASEHAPNGALQFNPDDPPALKEEDLWETFPVKKAKRKKNKVVKPELPSTTKSQILTNNAEGGWGNWGKPISHQGGKKDEPAPVEKLLATEAGDDWLGWGNTKAYKHDTKGKAAIKESSIKPFPGPKPEQREHDNSSKYAMSEDPMDVDDQPDAEPQSQLDAPDNSRENGNKDLTGAYVSVPSKRLESQKQGLTSSYPNSGEAPHYGLNYLAYTTRQRTRAHIRGNKDPASYYGHRRSMSPRYSSTGEYSTRSRFRSDNPPSSSQGSDVRPKHDRRSQYTYFQASFDETADCDDVFEIDGITYVMPSSKRTRSNYYDYPAETYTHGPCESESFNHFSHSNYDEPTQRSSTHTLLSTRRASTYPRRPSTTRPTGPHRKRAPVAVKATEEDAKKHRIPTGYSLKNWDPSEEPIMLLGSVFDSNSLGKWIYDWTVYHHGPATPISDMAGELWLLLIQLAGKIKRSEECMPRIRSVEDREMVEDFIESGERLTDKLRLLLKKCEAPMLKAHNRKQAQLGKNSGIEFVETLFGRERELERTERFMQTVRLWNLRFDANCEEILKMPARSRPIPTSQPISVLAQAKESLEQPSPQENTEDRGATSSIEQDDWSKDEVSSSYGEEISDEEVAETLENSHPLAQEVPTLVKILLEEFAGWRTCQGHSGSSKSGKPASSNSAQNTTRSKKRGREMDEEGPSDDDGSMSPKNTKRRSGDSDEDESLLLACPFYKHDEVRHQKCLKHILRRVKNVKEHLRRCHKQPNFCPLCGQVFNNKVELDGHLRARTCDARGYQEPEGITEDHERSFRSKVDKKLTLSEQWKSVWTIIFPTEEPPKSPFIQGTLHEGLACFRKFRNEKGPAIISDYVRAYIQSHDLVDGILNPERTLEALLETATGKAMDAVIEAYYDSLSAAQEDDGMPSMGNSEIATQATGYLNYTQDPANQLNFSNRGGQGDVGISALLFPALKPAQRTQDTLSQDWAGSDVLAGTTESLTWQDSYDENFGIGDFNLFAMPNNTGPTVLSQDPFAQT